jgi:hypothetical protein
MSLKTLKRVQPLHAERIPPDGDDGQPAVVIGQTQSGNTLYQRTLIRAAKQKAPVLGEDGRQVYAKHPTTGEPLYSKWRNQRHERLQFFTLESDGQGNLYIQEYQPPSQDELRDQKRKAKVAETQARLAEALVDNDVSPEAFVMALKGGELGEEDSTVNGRIVYPVRRGGGHWTLSDGSAFRGNEQAAKDAEAALQASVGIES